MTNLQNYEKAVTELTNQFLKKYFCDKDTDIDDLDWYWVGGEIGSVLFVNDCFFDLNRIIESFRYKASKENFFGYYEYQMKKSVQNTDIVMNFKTYSSMGKEWQEELSECGDLHNEDCCVHFPEDSRACDVGTGIVSCCENMCYISNLIRNEKAKSKEEENQRWIEMAKAHRKYCTPSGNKILTRMMGKKNKVKKLESFRQKPDIN